MSTAVKEFETGAVRGTDADGERYDLISPVAMRRLAETCAEGSAKYADFNWERGVPICDLLNHGLRHLFLYLAGNRDEDHLTHALWNIAAAIHSEELWPELNVGTLRRPGCLPPLADVEKPRTALDHGVPVALHAGWNKATVLDFDTAGVVIPDDDDREKWEHVRYSQWGRLRCPYCGVRSVRVLSVEVFGGGELLTLPKTHDYEEDGAEHVVDLRGYKLNDPENGACVTLDFRCSNGHDISYRHLTDTEKIDVLS